MSHRKSKIRDFCSGTGLVYVVSGLFGGSLGWINQEYLGLEWWAIGMLLAFCILPIVLYVAVPFSNLVVFVFDDMTNGQFVEKWEPKKR